MDVIEFVKNGRVVKHSAYDLRVRMEANSIMSTAIYEFSSVEEIICNIEHQIKADDLDTELLIERLDLDEISHLSDQEKDEIRFYFKL